MNIIKTDKRIKYNDIFTLRIAFDKKYNIDFNILETIINTYTKKRYLVLEVKQGYNKVAQKELRKERYARDKVAKMVQEQPKKKAFVVKKNKNVM